MSFPSVLGSLALLLGVIISGAPSPEGGNAPGAPAASGEAAPSPSGEAAPTPAPAGEQLPRLPPPPPAPPPPPPPPAPPEPGRGPRGEVAPGAPVPALPPSPRPTGEPPAPKEETWLDVGHGFIEHRIFAPVLRVDRFFSDERDLEAERSRSFVRWRNELRLTENSSTPSYAASFSANLRLPGLNKQLRRLRIEILGQTREAISALLPGESPAAIDGTLGQETRRTADAGVRFQLWETLRSHGDLGGGVIAQLPPGAYGRVRVRFVEPLGRRVLARQAVTGFWRTDTRFGTTVSAELERPLARTFLARLAGTSTLSEVSRGAEWIGDLSLLATFRERIGAQLGFAANGATASPVTVDRYRFYTRLRRDFYRRWIFVEIEPEYAWPWTPDRGREALWAVALRLEFQFQGTEAPPPAPPPEPPEPADPPPLDALPEPRPG